MQLLPLLQVSRFLLCKVRYNLRSLF